MSENWKCKNNSAKGFLKCLCISKWNKCEGLMSTPADNTRIKKASGKTTLHNLEQQEESASFIQQQRVPLRRNKRQVLKQALYETNVNKKNELVVKWLAQAGNVNRKNESKDNSLEDWANIGFDAQNDKRGPFDSLHSSEVSFKPITMSMHSHVDAAEDSVYKEGAEKDMRSSCADEDSIMLGHSAVSGHSNASSRRLLKSKKLQGLARLHGRAELNHGQIVSSQSYETADNMSIRSQPRRGEMTTQQSEESRSRTQENRSECRSDRSNTNQQNETVKAAGENREKEETELRKLNTSKTTDEEQDADQEDQKNEQFGMKMLEDFKVRLEENDTTVFYNMFELIITKLTVVAAEIKQVKDEQKQMFDRIVAVEEAIDSCTQGVNEMDEELAEASNTNVKLIQAVIKCEDATFEIKKSVNNIQKKLNQSCFIVNGLYRNENTSAKKAVTTFCKEKLGISEINITTAHGMGKANHAPIWFELADPEDSALIYGALEKLKDLVNEKGRKYRVRGFKTDEERANDMRKQDIKMENRRLPQSHQMDLSFSKGKLYINEEEYVPPLNALTSKDALLLSVEKECELDKIRMHISEIVEENGSSFQAIVCEVKSIEEVKLAYESVNNDHISATHVMCAYRIFGSKFYELQNFADGGEHGAGRVMLEAIKSLKVWNIAAFVVRYHNGPNLGRRRFDIISDLVKNTITSLPGRLNYGRYFTDQVTLQALNKSADRPANNYKKFDDFVRGFERGRGRGGRRRGRRGGYNERGRGAPSYRGYPRYKHWSNRESRSQFDQKSI